ncbi:hypothetical protein GCM10012286_50900 [Streptomyces lasiicapitis]|uniref:Uncharacterized protein n=1 Tax=Streptomyces lasiicapitis TaxID=1923961 RepID=A0ABQ2MDF2_9ACTN|nr:hypothetical protein GCM10012286_50900 [Streptomyces lasiicapitis]
MVLSGSAKSAGAVRAGAGREVLRPPRPPPFTGRFPAFLPESAVPWPWPWLPCLRGAEPDVPLVAEPAVRGFDERRRAGRAGRSGRFMGQAFLAGDSTQAGTRTVVVRAPAARFARSDDQAGTMFSA